jgi:hypothetical protein
MKSLPLYSVLCAIAAQALISGACALQPDRAARLYREVWGVPEGEQQWNTSQRKKTRANRALSDAKERIERTAEPVAEDKDRPPNYYLGNEGYNSSEAYRYYQASGCGSGR